MSDQFVEALVREVNLLRSQLDEARAELEVITRQCDRQILEAMRAVADRDALRAAIEAHNDFVEYVCLHNRDANEQLSDFLIPLPPAAAALGDGHASDCATHNAPALPVGPCGCDEAPEAGPKS